MNSDSEDSHRSESRGTANKDDSEEIRALRAELSKLRHLDGDHADRRPRRRPSGERRLAERQDVLESQLTATRQANNELSKNLFNMLDPLSADITRRFEESDRKFEDVKAELKREGREVRRKIREYEADLECISQQIEATAPGADGEYQECEEEDNEDEAREQLLQQVRRRPHYGDLTYDELNSKIRSVWPPCSFAMVNEQWTLMEVVADGIFELRTDSESQSALPAPARPAEPALPAPLEPVAGFGAVDGVDRRLFSPALGQQPQSPMTVEPQATT